MASTERAGASTGPRWSVTELVGFSDVIVTGRVEAVTAGWDPIVTAIYTYVTLDVDEVFKGGIGRGRLTIKQLGGVAGEVGLHVTDQAAFQSGEHVLLFLEARPRDHTLYTSALSQGKWQVGQLPDGQRVATRGGEILSIGFLRTTTSATFAFERREDVETSPFDVVASQPLTLMSPAYRYSFWVAVEVQAGGQPGLAAGGFTEIQTAIGRWNNAGSSFRFLSGSSSAEPRCSDQFLATYRVTISFMDPCAEMSNSGGTIAIGGSYFTTIAGMTVNGRSYRLALEGFIINNDSSVALQFLHASGCFHDIQLHELGHVLGLGHSTDPGAIMFPSINANCMSGPTSLGIDDVQGIQFIYPTEGGTPGQSTVTRASAHGEFLTVEWASGPGAPPTSHRLDFFTGSLHVVGLTVGPTTSVVIPIPTGTEGIFSVRVTPYNGSTPGPSSNAFTFVIGVGGLTCTSPPLPPTLSGSVVSGTAAVSWLPVPGATHYTLQVGTMLGGFDLVPVTNLGTSTAVSASGLPLDFSAWVRVIAVNACGQSAPSDFRLQSIQGFTFDN